MFIFFIFTSGSGKIQLHQLAHTNVRVYDREYCECDSRSITNSVKNERIGIV